MPGAQVELSVRDEGTGIAAEDQGRIFEPFCHDQGRGRGTGSAVYLPQLSADPGGTITVASTPGQGLDDRRPSAVGAQPGVATRSSWVAAAGVVRRRIRDRVP